MDLPRLPAFSPTLVQAELCTVCSQTPFHKLPSEDEDAYPHHLTLDALKKSGDSCALCALLYWAAGCTFGERGGMVAWQNIQLSSGAQVSARSSESLYYKGMRAFENGAVTVDFSAPVVDYRPPIQVDLSVAFPNGTVMKDGEAKQLRPWLFGNWYKSPFGNNEQSLMIGLGIRLGTSGKIEDTVDRCEDSINLRGSYLRFRTDQGAMFLACIIDNLNLTSS